MSFQGMENFRGQCILVDIFRWWIFVDIFHEFSWTSFVHENSSSWVNFHRQFLRWILVHTFFNVTTLVVSKLCWKGQPTTRGAERIPQIREQMSGLDLHVFTLKFLALKKPGFSPIKNTFQNFFDFCLPLFNATFQCRH